MNMMLQAFAAVKAPETMADRFSLSGTVLLEGMLVIFCVLTLLWGAIELLHLALSGDSKKRSEDAPTVAKSAPASAPAPTTLPAAPVADDGAVVAAIIAAISAARAEEGQTGGFRVVRFERASSRKNRF